MSMWNLVEALKLIRGGLQTDARKYGYHLCMGGGVLNKGTSDKDLDLYFLPMGNSYRTMPVALLRYLESLWGQHEAIGGRVSRDGVAVEPYPKELPYIGKVRFYQGGSNGARIECFILGTVEQAKELGMAASAEIGADTPLTAPSLNLEIMNDRSEQGSNDARGSRDWVVEAATQRGINALDAFPANAGIGNGVFDIPGGVTVNWSSIGRLGAQSAAPTNGTIGNIRRNNN